MLLAEYGEAINADMRHYYPGTSVGDLYTGRLTYLELDGLINRLPMESAFRTAIRDQFTDAELAAMSDDRVDAPHGPWSKTNSLIATLIDAVMVLINVQLSRAGVETQPIEPVRRPGVVSKRAQPANPQQLAYLSRIREQHEQQRAEREAT